MDLDRAFAGTDPAWPRYAVVGWPLGHSLSPALHTAALKFFDIPAVYRAVPVSPQEWPLFSQRLKEPQGLVGFNVTLPHKERVGALFTNGRVTSTPYAEAAGAVNTAVRGPGGWLLDNTDGAGFLADLGDQGIETGGKHVVVLGAGGAARAIVFAFRDLSRTTPKLVTVLNRTVSRADRLSYDVAAGTGGGLRVRSAAMGSTEARGALRTADVVVNATSSGLTPADPVPVPADLISPRAVFYDLIYHRETPLGRLLRERGQRSVGGLGMLVNQAALSFELWFGRVLKNKVKYAENLRQIMRQAADLKLKETP